jgi:hypothetical protein
MTTHPLSAKTAAGPPGGEALLTSSSYGSAVAAVDALADAHFPVERVTIVGRGVRTVEKVTGRSGFGRALAGGALNGGMIGLFYGLLFEWWGALTLSADWEWLALWGLIYGAVIGGVIGLAFHWFADGARRDFASAQSLEADRYEVVLTGGDREQAVRILREAGLLAREAA